MSTPIGLLGPLMTTLPVITLMLLVTALGSRQQMAGAGAHVIAQAAGLPLLGFSFATAAFFVAVLPTAALTPPRTSPWRHPFRNTVLCVLAALVGVAGFAVGSYLRHAFAAARGVSSENQQASVVGRGPSLISAKLNLGDPLQQAADVKDERPQVQAISMSSQFQAFVPPLLWPDMPAIDEGQQLITDRNGSEASLSNSTITTIGGLLSNFGISALLAIAMLLGVILRMAERENREGVGLSSLVLATGLSSLLLLRERPLTLAFACLLRECPVAIARGRRASLRAACA